MGEAIVLGAALLGWAVLLVYALLRVAGRDPLGRHPAGDLPRTGQALLAGALLWLLAVAAVQAALGGTDAARWGGSTLLTFAVASAHALVALAILPLVRRDGLAPRIGPARIVAAGALTATAAVALQAVYGFALDTVYRASGRELPSQEVVQAASRAEGLETLAFGCATIALAPFAEEVLFRGALTPFLVRAMGRRAGLLAQALLFGAIHVSAPEHWPLALPLAAVGWLAGWLYLRTGSLAAPIAMHAAFNAINFAALRLIEP